jgi:4-amino-4-deoxy-L-arabinose transferase-like glycosyltransferase
VLLLAAVAIIGAAWALLVPAWQAPDEPPHFSYAQGLAENLELPGEEPGRINSSEVDLSVEGTQADVLAQNLLARAEWDERAYRDWRAKDGRLPAGSRANGGGRLPGGSANPARTNPPLYYLYLAPPYLADSGGDLFDRLFVMRLWSMLLLLVSTAAAWLLVGEVLGRRPVLQLVGAAVAGLQPMASAISASVSPDAMLIATWSVALWLGARIVLRGLTPAPAVALAVTVAAAVLTKATGYALVPAAAFALVVGLWHRRRQPGIRSLAVPAIAAAALLVPIAGWLVLARGLGRSAINRVPGVTQDSGLDVGSFLDYLWQFYLPNLPGQDRFPLIPRLPVYDVWIKTGWGAFGWLEIRLPGAFYPVLAAVSVALVIGIAAALLRRRGTGGLALLGFFGLTAAALLGGLHVVEFQMITRDGTGFNQGRYLLPLLPLAAVGAAGLIDRLRGRAQPIAVGAVLGALVFLQLASLAAVAGRFYA